MQTMYRSKLIAVTGILIGGMLVAACSQPSAQAKPQPAAPAEVGVVEVQPQRVAITTELAGRTSPHMIAEVRPQVGGIVQKRLFTEGSDVKAGEVLYQIDPASYQAAYNSAKAALNRSEANLVPVRLKTERYRDLVKINAVSHQDYDDVSASLKQAEADVDAGRATLETARINLAYTRIKAPISGRIGRSSVTIGALVTAGQAAPLSTIQQLDPIYVDVTQSSAEMLRMKRDKASGQLKNGGPGQAKVKLLLEDGTPYPLDGVLKFSDVTVDQSSGSVTLRSLFPNPKKLLLPGMYVRAILEEGVSEHAILVPQQGVTRDPAGNATAMVVAKGDLVEPRKLTVSRAIGNKWLVSEGLKAGDRLIVEGLQKARPGSPVKPVPFGSKSVAAVAPGVAQTAAAKK